MPESKYTFTFTMAEINQLLAYVSDRERTGWYYGHKGQFEQRHKRIAEKLSNLTRGAMVERKVST
jgi:hypothetical protein